MEAVAQRSNRGRLAELHRACEFLVSYKAASSQIFALVFAITEYGARLRRRRTTDGYSDTH